MTNFSPETPISPKLQNWQLDGRRLEADERGVYIDWHTTGGETDDLPIVMMGGIGSNVHSLHRLGDKLSDMGHDVLRVDVTRSPKIGRGALKAVSLWGKAEMADIKTYAGLINDTLDAEGIDRAYLVGHSFGGVQAEMAAIDHKDRVAGLALLNTVGGFAICPPTPEALEMVSKPSREDINEVARVYGGPFLDNPQLVADLGMNKPRDHETERAYRLSQSTAPSSLLRVAPMIHRLQQPTLVVTGEYDPLVPSPNADYLHYWLPDSTLRTIGGGHMDLIVDADPFADAISDHHARIKR